MNLKSLLFLGLASVTFAASACSDDGSMTPDDTFALAVSSPSGRVATPFLVDNHGRTLYIFELDVPAGGGKAAVSNCAGSCLSVWPVFHVNGNPVSGIDAHDLGELVRSDGKQQSTYKGFPLYTFAGDSAPGQLNGEALTDGGPTAVWFAARKDAFAVMSLVDAQGKPRLTDGAGMTLYVTTHDTAGSPPTVGCTGTCLAAWPQYNTTSRVLPSTIDASRLTNFQRPDGFSQLALDGRPLYYFVHDAAPGDNNGITFAPAAGSFLDVDPAVR